jgi:hypothetical protein
MNTITDTAAATGRHDEPGGYDGPGAYLTTSGARVWLDMLPEPQADYLGDMLIWSETAEDRDRPMPNRGTFWGRRDLIEAVIARKIEEAGQ